jgi:Flp pilus assembly protein TadD
MVEDSICALRTFIYKSLEKVFVMIAKDEGSVKMRSAPFHGVAFLFLCFCAITAFSAVTLAQTPEEIMPVLKNGGGKVQKVAPVEGDVPTPAPIVSENDSGKITPPSGDEAEFSAGGVTESPDAPDPNLYYDSETVPVTDLPREAGPRKTDPRKEPASRFVVVEKTHGPNSTQAQLVAAERAIKLGRYGSAVEIYEKLAKKNSRDQRILMGLAIAYQKNGQAESAVRAYQKLLDVYPRNIDARANLLGLMREISPAEALRDLLDMREKDPSNPGLAAQTGLAHAELGNFEEAMRYLGMAASMEPNNPVHLYNMAVVADKAGNSEEAVDLYRQSLEADAVYAEGSLLPREVVYDRIAVLSH